MEMLLGVTGSQYEGLWSAPHNWYEAPNYRRGGWSGVCKIDIERPMGKLPVFLKLQSSHTYRSWRSFLLKRPTILREYQNIKGLEAAGVPTLDVEVFAVRGDNAILGTRALDDYESLDQLDLEELTTHQRRRLIRAIARYIRRIHLLHYQHNCLYPKHIFVCQIGNTWSVRLIDLEKMRRIWSVKSAMYHDLSTLYRRSSHLFNRHDRFAFMRAYLGRDWSLSVHCKIFNKLTYKARFLKKRSCNCEGSLKGKLRN